MLVDLGQADVGRVAKTDLSQWTPSWTLSGYSHVMHLVNCDGCALRP
jgi:anthranilate/para-aminobenzoate synthase component I